jgi:hypothetical protein
MAKIKNTTAYPTVTPASNDLIIGTDVSDNKKTVTFTVSSLGGGGGVNQDLNSVLGVGNTSLLNIELNGNASALGSSISVIDIFPTTISAGGLGSHGTAGQVLSSTGTGLAWIAAPGTTQSWNDTLAVSPIATANPNLTGTFTIQTGGGLSLLGNSTLSVSGTSIFYSNVTLSDGVNLKVSDQSQIGIDDGTGTYVYGTPGQFLSATANGLAWSSAGTLTTPTLQQVVTAGNTLLNSSIVFTGTGGITLSGTNTITGQGVINFNGDGTPTSLATQGRLIISQGSISLSGANSQILLAGSSGTSGQALVSNGPFVTPTWQTVSGINETLQQVLDNGNTATQNITLTGNINLAGGGLKLAANAFIELNADRGTLGQVLISGGPAGFPTWASAGTGTVTAVNVSDTTYIDMSVDNSTPSTPSVNAALITTGSVATGPGGLTQAFYDDDVTGTNYTVQQGLTTTATVGNGSGIIVTINSTSGGNVVLSDLSFVSGGSGYASGDKFRVNQTGSDNNLIIEVDAIASGTYYDQTGKFSLPSGNDWDLAVSNVGNLITVTNSDGARSSSFTLQGSGGAVFSNAGSNNIELSFTGSGTGTVQSISLTDSTGSAGTAITSSGTFTFAEQAANGTYLRTTSAVSGTTITLSTETPTIQVVATKGGTLLDKALTIQNSNGTTNNSFVLGTTASPSVATAGQVLAFNSANGGYMEWVNQAAGGNMTSWNINGDTGGAGTVSDGETVTIAGGNGISTVSTPGTRTITIGNTGVLQVNSFAGNITLDSNANSTVGTKAVLTASITAAGTGYVANTYYPTTKISSVIGTATGVVVRVTSVNGTGGITGVQIYGGGKDWTIGDIFGVNFGSSTAQCTVASVGATGTVTTTTWRGLSGTDVSSSSNYEIKSIGRFEDELTMYSSSINEVVSTGASSTFTGSFISVGTSALATTPINGITILDNTGEDLGLISRATDTNIKIGAYGSGWNYSNAACLNNIGIGGATNQSLTTGEHNIAIGENANVSNDTGNNNIAIGKDALFTSAGGTANIIIGGLAGRDAIPVGDIFIGSNAGRYASNDTGLPNNSSSQLRVVIGSFAMVGDATYKHEHNLGDVIIGDRAKQYKASTATGANEGSGVYIGQLAAQGYNNFRSSGNSAYHVCIGYNSMGNGGASAREGQVAIGYAASIGSQTIETETYNTSTKGIAIGYQSEGAAADYSSITRSGVGNIAIGVLAAGINGSVIQGGTIAIGTSAIAQGENSIAIGKNSDASSGAGVDNAIAIGFGAQATFANSVAIGTSAATTSANTIAFGSNTQNLGVVASSVATASTHKWPVRINGVDYNILLAT